MTLKFEFGLDFLTMHLPTRFHHLMFNHSEVIALTNILQTNQQTNKEILFHCAVLVENIKKLLSDFGKVFLQISIHDMNFMAFTNSQSTECRLFYSVLCHIKVLDNHINGATPFPFQSIL